MNKQFYALNIFHQDSLLQAYRLVFGLMIIAGSVRISTINALNLKILLALFFSWTFVNIMKAITFRKKDVDYFQKMLINQEHLDYMATGNSQDAVYHLFKATQDCRGDLAAAHKMREDKVGKNNLQSTTVMSGHKSATRALIDSSLWYCGHVCVWAPVVDYLLLRYKIL